jgi:hypothetical protein
MNKFKNRKTKRAVEHTPFLKKIAACQSVSQCVCEIVKLSGFERPQKIETKIYAIIQIAYKKRSLRNDNELNDIF